MDDFRGELRALINRYSKENQSHTPDFILAEFMDDSLRAFDAATVRREEWYGRESAGPSALVDVHFPGGGVVEVRREAEVVSEGTERD